MQDFFHHQSHTQYPHGKWDRTCEFFLSFEAKKKKLHHKSLDSITTRVIWGSRYEVSNKQLWHLLSSTATSIIVILVPGFMHLFVDLIIDPWLYNTFTTCMSCECQGTKHNCVSSGAEIDVLGTEKEATNTIWLHYLFLLFFFLLLLLFFYVFLFLS